MVQKKQAKVRCCTINDILTLCTLARQTFRETFEASNTQADMEMYLNDTFTTEHIQSELEEQGTFFFIAEYEGEPLGYAKLQLSEKPTDIDGYAAMEIERLYARRDAIGKGIGSKLMQKCLHQAKKIGCDVVWLGVWERNERALIFYEKWGFTKFGSHVFMLGNDAQNDLLLQKRI